MASRLQESPRSLRDTARPGSVLVRLAVFGTFWWALTEGDRYNLWFGALCVVAATLTSIVMLPSTELRVTGIVRFIPFFVRQSVIGGIDVARRAFSPRLPLDPGFVEVPLRLPEGTARVLLANTVGLLPGTFVVELRPASLALHVLDRSMPIEQTVRETEDRIADIFGVSLDGEIPVAGTASGANR